MTGQQPMNDIVVVLPGIMGSVLAKHGRPIWKPSLGVLGRALQRDALLNDLALAGDDPERDSLDDGVVPTGLMPDVRIIPGFWKIDGYGDFIAHLKAAFALKEGDAASPDPDANLFPFPYDWRRDNRASARRLKALVDLQLPRWRQRRGNPKAKVILIAHSMGGLVARHYLELLGGWEHCRALITMGTPFRGSLNALRTLADGLAPLPWVNLSDAVRSFTSTYQLLPVYPVVERADTTLRLTELTGLQNLDMDRVGAAAGFHQAMADAARQREDAVGGPGYWMLPTVGIQQRTLQAATLAGAALSFDFEPSRGMVKNNIPGFGDGTVPYYAALPPSSRLMQPFFVPHGHGALQNSDEVRRQIDQCLQLLQIDPGALDMISFAPAAQPGLRLLVEDLYSTAGGRIAVQPVDADPGAVTLRLVALDEAGQPTLAREMAREGAEWVYDLAGLRPGAYRVIVEPANRSELRPLQDLFEVVGEPDSAAWPFEATKPAPAQEPAPADQALTPAPAPADPALWHSLVAEVRALQRQVGRVADALAALAPPAPPAPAAEPAPDAEPAPPPVAEPAPATGAAPPAEAAPPARRAPRTLSLPQEAAGLSFVADHASFAFHRKDAAPAELLPVNGIDLTSGKYLLELDVEAAKAAARAAPDGKGLNSLHKNKYTTATEASFGMAFGLDEDSLADSRWAVVVNAAEDPAVLAALTPLIRHRAEGQGITLKDEQLNFSGFDSCGAWYYSVISSEQEHRDRWLELPPVLIYREGESVGEWLARHGVAQGPVVPKRGVPFYLALVGRPGPLVEGDAAYIPFEFQYELDLYWGVGRLCFTNLGGQNEPRGYADYAERLVAIEQRADAAERLAREVAYFGTQHEGDRATFLSATELIAPLHKEHAEDSLIGAGSAGFERRLFLAGDATRSNLESLLRGAERPPAVLFTATHGAGLPLGHPDQLASQGALVLQEWGGGVPAREHYFAGADLGAAARVEGMVAVMFACFGGGSPAEDQFLFDEGQRRPAIAPFPFVARLPQAMLRNGAVAVLSHVDRAWNYSFSTAGTPGQIQNYQDVLSRIVRGKRMGFATDQFNVMQSSRSLTLTKVLEDMRFGQQVPALTLALLWMARNDARNFALLGDPAARLPYR